MRTFACSLSLLFLAACGGSTTGGDGGDAGGDSGHDVFDMRVDLPTGDGSMPDGGLDAMLPDLGVDATLPDGGHAPAFHRTSDATCTTPAPAGNCMFAGGPGMCSHDSDCTMMPGGRCDENMGGAVFCFCSYDTCATDTDCPTGQTCACHGDPLHPNGNECVPGNCRTDSDCGAGGYCSPTISDAGCGALAGYYCHTAADTCVDDSDCTGPGIQACEYDTTAMHWACVDRRFCA